MENLHSTPQTPKEIMEQAVQGYLDTNLYPKYSKPFQLQELRKSELAQMTRPHRLVYEAIMKNVGEEDLSVYDRDWLNGLNEVGMRFESEITLPYWYFEK